jgi:phosphoribosylformylglycinamidine cyclo-ligase
VLHRNAWRVPPVFEALRKAGQVADDEMLRTFNLGIGYVVVVPPVAAERAIAILIEAGESVSRIGEIAAGARGVEVVS